MIILRRFILLGVEAHYLLKLLTPCLFVLLRKLIALSHLTWQVSKKLTIRTGVATKLL